jgi:hypothetical protein
MRLKACFKLGLYAGLFIFVCGILNCGFDLLVGILRGRMIENFWSVHIQVIAYATIYVFILGGFFGACVPELICKKRNSNAKS